MVSYQHTLAAARGQWHTAHHEDLWQLSYALNEAEEEDTNAIHSIHHVYMHLAQLQTH